MTPPGLPPIRIGDTWYSRGRAGHNGYAIRILKRTSNGGVVFEATTNAGRRKRERKHTLPEPIFRAHYQPA